VTFGEFELVSLSDGTFRLDGGAMFGVVPKVLWQRRTTPDEKNRIPMGMRPQLIRTGSQNVIIDAGIGDKLGPKETEIYGVDRGTMHLDLSLAAAGLTARDIDVVIASHLHFDHAGGFTALVDNVLVPRFPRATYYIRRGEWEDATHPNERNRGSYLQDNYLPLAEAGVLQLVDEDRMIMPGVRVRRTGGHTMHHQIVLIESGGRTAAFAADLMPTTAHLPDAWIMGYDLYPLDTLSAKQQFVKQAIEKDMLVFFQHDPAIAAGYIREQNGKRNVEVA